MTKISFSKPAIQSFQEKYCSLKCGLLFKKNIVLKTIFLSKVSVLRIRTDFLEVIQISNIYVPRSGNVGDYVFIYLLLKCAESFPAFAFPSSILVLSSLLFSRCRRSAQFLFASCKERFFVCLNFHRTQNFNVCKSSHLTKYCNLVRNYIPFFENTHPSIVDAGKIW